MTVSYLDTVAAIEAAEVRGGLTYGEITRAKRIHVRSLVAEGLVAAYTGDDGVTELYDPEGVIWFTESGGSYVAMLREAGVLGEPLPESKPKAKRTKTRRRKTTKVKTTKTVPTPAESVESPVLPKGVTARRVPGNHIGDQLLVTSVTEDDRVAALERKVSALMAVLSA